MSQNVKATEQKADSVRYQCATALMQLSQSATAACTGLALADLARTRANRLGQALKVQPR